MDFLVTLEGAESFRGFLIVARPANNKTGAEVGSFAVANSPENTPLSQAQCGGVSVLLQLLCLS